MPKNVVVDPSISLVGPLALSSFMASGTVDIMFSPSGQVTGMPGGRLVFWVRDTNGAGGSASGTQTLLTVYTRTGGIGAYNVGPASDPYLFTRDGRGAGL